MFPSTVFRQAYDQLANDDFRHASRRYLKILEWAATNSESAMEQSLRVLLDGGEEEEVARKGEKEAITYERYLHELSQLEAYERHNRKIPQLLKQSRLPREKTLE